MMRTLITAICALTALCSALNAADVLRSPDGNIEVAFQSEEGVSYDLTLYEDAPNAHYEYIGPMHKLAVRAQKVKLVPQETRRELYQIKKITAKKGDTIPVVIAPGGGHCMWIRPAK